MIARVLIAGLFILILSSVSAQHPVRIEPPNWWIGMKDTRLQIMLYGENIGKLKPIIKHKGVRVERYSSPENEDYLFIDLTIKSNTRPGEVRIALNDNTHTKSTINYPLLKRESGSADRKGFDSKDVIYLITPDRFANGNISNDEIAGLKEGLNRKGNLDRHGGDIDGIRQHLNYIANMGFTSIWLNPVLENDMPRHSYHGYATTDFYKVDPRLGSNESYKSLCDEAKAMGIKVIKDLIVNHCGLHHWWMSSPPTKDWINYTGQPFVQTNHRKTLSMDPYASDEDKKILTEGWFVQTMPDLNTKNKYLATYLIQNSIWWIEFAGLSGIRMDTYLYPDEDFMSQWSGRIMQEYPSFNIAGEVWHDNPYVVSYWQRKRVKEKEGTISRRSHLPALFDFPLQNALRKALTTDDVWDSGWMYLYETIAQDAQYPDPENLLVFADNHDMSRLFTQVDEDISKYKLALAYILTVRGIPQLFYGTEVLMSNKGTDNHGVIRSDFPGGWKEDQEDAFSGAGLTGSQKEAQSFLKRLLMWRKNKSVIHTGRTMHYVPQDGVYVFFRYNDASKVMVVLNKNTKPVSLDTTRFESMLKGSTSGIDILSEKEILLSKEILLETAGPMIIEIKN